MYPVPQKDLSIDPTWLPFLSTEPPFSLSFLLLELRLTSLRSLSLSESFLLSATWCPWPGPSDTGAGGLPEITEAELWAGEDRGRLSTELTACCRTGLEAVGVARRLVGRGERRRGGLYVTRPLPRPLPRPPGPAQSERNQSLRARIRSVCFWCTCKVRMKDRKSAKIESYLGKTHGWFKWFGLSVGVPRLSPWVQSRAPEADGVGGAGPGLQLQQAVVSVQADREAPHGVQWAVLRNYLQGA